MFVLVVFIDNAGFMQNSVYYPIGIQTFSEIIEGGYLYVDKTEYVYNMTNKKKYVFLSRPRRFGKSLLVSTIKSYFEGRRDLFKGLAIERLEAQWDVHPVLHFSLATAKHATVEELESELNLKLLKYEAVYGKGEGEVKPNQRLQGLVERAYNQTKKQVVVLIDEYDAPLLDVMHDEARLGELRRAMQNFYSPLKDCDEFLRFLFITGITKFSQLSIFSELNNLKNISMLKEYAGICGITEREVCEQMGVGIDALSEEYGWTREKTLSELKSNYDGYHFAWPSLDVFNPYSLLNAMSDGVLDSYWFESGTPSYLIALFRKFGVDPSELGGEKSVLKSDFNVPIERLSDISPLLYQSGYLTIRGYDAVNGLYTLGIPNREIRIGLMKNLLPNYLGSRSVEANTTTAYMQTALLNDDVEGMLLLLQKYLGTIPGVDYVNRPENFESHWQQMLYIIFSLLGARVDVEVRTPKGRVDMVARTAKALYLFELKLNRNADAAMGQIELNDYAGRFALCGLPVVKVGVNFSADERNITDWVVRWPGW